MMILKIRHRNKDNDSIFNTQNWLSPHEVVLQGDVVATGRERDEQ